MEASLSRSYGPLSSSLRPPSPAPRRAFSLPAMRSYLPSLASTAQLLPLSSLSRPGSPGAPGSRTAKRLSYTLRNRASKNKFRLIVGSLLLTALFLWVNSHTKSLPVTRRLRARGAQTVLSGHRKTGVTLMDVDDTDEWLAEDDLFYSQYTEDTPLSPEDAAAEAEMASRKADVIEQNRQQSLRALTWWLAEGGEIPDDWEVPSKAYLKKVGGRGVERMLEDIEDPELGEDPMFEEGWAEFAKKRYRTIVFSKTHCPYSRSAKSILSQYHLSPAPFIVELDTRPDTAQLQDLLLHLTGRRTVPNILLDFVSIGGSDDLTLMHSEGGLRRKFQEMGLIPGRPGMFPIGGKPNPPAFAPVANAPKPEIAGLDNAQKIDHVIPEQKGYAPVAPPRDPIQGATPPDEEFDDEEEEDEDEEGTALLPGTNPADIRAAVQAAHGDDYLYDGEDDEDFDGTEEFAPRPPTDSIFEDSLDPYDDYSESYDPTDPTLGEETEYDTLDDEEEDDGEDDEDEWEGEDGDDFAPVRGGGAAAQAKAIAEAARAEEERVRAKAEADRAAELKRKAEAELEARKEAEAKRLAEETKAKRIAEEAARARAQAQAKPKAKPKGKKAKPRAKANLQPKANLDTDSLVKKADVAPAALPKIPEHVLVPPPQHAKPIDNDAHVPPQKKADTLLERTNAHANALQKKKAAVAAAKARAAAGKDKKAVAAPEWADKAAVEKNAVEKKEVANGHGANDRKAAPPANKPHVAAPHPAPIVDNHIPVPPAGAANQLAGLGQNQKAQAAAAAAGAGNVNGKGSTLEEKRAKAKAAAAARKAAGEKKAVPVPEKKAVVGAEKKAVVGGEKKAVEKKAAGVAGGAAKAPVKKAAAGGAGAKAPVKKAAGAAGAKAKKVVAKAAPAGKRKGRVL